MIPAFGLPTASESGQLIRLVRRFAASPRLCRAIATYARYPSPCAHDAIHYAMARAKAAGTAPANQEPQP